jgi:hypothetical protein
VAKHILKDVVKQKIEKKEASKPLSGIKTLAQKSGCIGDDSSDDDKPAPHKYIIILIVS